MSPFRPLLASFSLALLGLLPLHAADQDLLAESLERAGRSYAERLATASTDLNNARARVLREKTPLLTRWQELERQALALENQINRLKTSKEQDQEKRRALAKENDLLRKNLGYLNTLAGDGMKSLELSLQPGEPTSVAQRLRELQGLLEGAATNGDGKVAVEVARLGLARLRQGLGGYTLDGPALIGNDTRIVQGRFAFAGPETFFLAADASQVGIVRTREGSPLPIVHLIADWPAEKAAPVFKGAQGILMADPSGGKALHLIETQGSMADHIHRGGVVAYAILAIGAVALLLIGLKCRDLLQLSLDRPETIERLLQLVAAGEFGKARDSLPALKATTRELLGAGLDKVHLPKELLEESLDALLTRQRLHSERRLPLLAVIATASPLMGLLGTVMGMVKTFALITVFGTGNAGKLSSGISEVLVTTELGLAVAIPSLVAHGYLSHRIHKQLALLERYAFEFVLAAEQGKLLKAPASAAAPHGTAIGGGNSTAQHNASAAATSSSAATSTATTPGTATALPPKSAPAGA